MTDRARVERRNQALRVARPSAVSGATPRGSLQRLHASAGNRAVARVVAERSRALQRDRSGGVVPVTAVRVTPGRLSVPLTAATVVRATATPSGASGVLYSLEDGSARRAGGTTIDPTTGVVAVDPAQPGGSLVVRATSSDGAYATLPFHLVETPTGIRSTSSSVHGAYEAHFIHTFAGGGGSGAGLEGANVNERFAATRVATPFGPFALTANAVGSHGWDLDASGTMAGPDRVSLDATTVAAAPFVRNASNPAPPRTLPQGFEMTQNLHATIFPSRRLAATPFTTTQHVRRLEESGGALVVVVGAGAASESMDYVGPAVFRNATVDQPSVEASPPRPPSGTWERVEARVSVDVLPVTATPQFWIPQDALGCVVDGTGTVRVGDRPGTITVRVGDRARSSFDAVSLTIVPRPTP